MATKKKKPAGKKGKGKQLSAMDWKAVHKLAAHLEKANIGDYVALINRPWRNFWLNLVAGIARGVGMVLGASVVGVVLVVLVVQGLKYAFQHAGGMPIVGEYVEQGIGWVLDIINQKQGGE